MERQGCAELLQRPKIVVLKNLLIVVVTLALGCSGESGAGLDPAWNTVFQGTVRVTLSADLGDTLETQEELGTITTVFEMAETYNQSLTVQADRLDEIKLEMDASGRSSVGLAGQSLGENLIVGPYVMDMTLNTATANVETGLLEFLATGSYIATTPDSRGSFVITLEE